MTARLQAIPSHLLDEEFDASDMHPADIEQLLEAALTEYQSMQPHTKQRAKYRNAYNKIVSVHTEKRGWQVFNYIR